MLTYLEFARRFLAQNAQEGEVHLDRLLAADVVGFVQQEAARLHHAKRAKLMTTALRSFLQYALYCGLIRGRAPRRYPPPEAAALRPDASPGCRE